MHRLTNIKNIIVIYTLLLGITITADAHSHDIQHDSFGDLVFGHKLDTTKFKVTPQQTEINGCTYVTVEGYPELQIMLVDGIIKRLDTETSQLLTQDSPFYGLASGSMTIETFTKQYPQIEVELHEYENGYYLRWYNKDQSKAIVADFVEGKITLIKAGLVPEVIFVEGCA